MNCALGRNRPSRLSVFLLVALLGGLTAGCASIAEKLASHLAEKDVKAMDSELKIFHSDLGLFRKCLKERGGSCQGSDTTALPGTSQDAEGLAVAPAAPGSSQELAASVAQLPAGSSARGALAVLAHPVVQQAAALHNHLRGHDTGSVPGFSVAHGKGAHGGPESTATMEMGVGHVQHLHKGLLSSVSNNGWESLHERCKSLLAAKSSAAGGSALEADCRRVAFIRGYLEAYTHHGELLDVALGTSAVDDAAKEAAKIKNEIFWLLKDIQKGLKTSDPSLASVKSANPCASGSGVSGSSPSAKTLKEIANVAGKVSNDVNSLVAKIEGSLDTRAGRLASELFGDLKGLTTAIGTTSESLTGAVDNEVDKEVSKAALKLDGELGKVCSELTKAVNEVSKLFADANKDLQKEFSNVVKLAGVGFVSRDQTFHAMLPELEVTLDPMGKRFFTLTDASPGAHQGQVLTRKSNFGDLGVATDRSGVGTGSSIGAEVVRVFLDAIFDAHEGLPALNAVRTTQKPTGLTLSDYPLQLFNTKSGLGNVSGPDFQKMTNVNDRVAAGTRAKLSAIIAGIGPFSLNNQPLEDFIVEIITTSVRHGTAKASWCWYACNLDVDLKKLEADAKTAVDDKVKAVEGEVKAKVKKVEGEAKAKAEKAEREAKANLKEAGEHAGEHVKLRIKLGK